MGIPRFQGINRPEGTRLSLQQNILQLHYLMQVNPPQFSLIMDPLLQDPTFAEMVANLFGLCPCPFPYKVNWPLIYSTMDLPIPKDVPFTGGILDFPLYGHSLDEIENMAYRQDGNGNDYHIIQYTKEGDIYTTSDIYQNGSLLFSKYPFGCNDFDTTAQGYIYTDMDLDNGQKGLVICNSNNQQVGYIADTTYPTPTNLFYYLMDQPTKTIYDLQGNVIGTAPQGVYISMMGIGMKIDIDFTNFTISVGDLYFLDKDNLEFADDNKANIQSLGIAVDGYIWIEKNRLYVLGASDISNPISLYILDGKLNLVKKIDFPIECRYPLIGHDGHILFFDSSPVAGDSFTIYDYDYEGNRIASLTGYIPIWNHFSVPSLNRYNVGAVKNGLIYVSRLVDVDGNPIQGDVSFYNFSTGTSELLVPAANALIGMRNDGTLIVKE